MHILLFAAVFIVLSNARPPQQKDNPLKQKKTDVTNLLKRLGRIVKSQSSQTFVGKTMRAKGIRKGERHFERLNRNASVPLFDGDMLISPNRLAEIVSEAEKVSGRSPRQAYRDNFYPATIWRDGIPYEFDKNLNKGKVASLKRAMEFWQNETCVTFRPRKNETQYLFYSSADSGCYSAVGLDSSEPKQIVNIGEGCQHFGITTHEIAHALGVFHQQQRYDRSKYVFFNSANVAEEYLQNFAIIPSMFLSTYDLPYDIGSVMHYTPTEFASNRWVPSLVALNDNLQGSMGSMDQPTFLDVQLINRHYQCLENKCGKEVPPLCINGGYQDPNDCKKCKCPSGFDGDLCERIESSEPMPCGGLLPASYKLQRMKITLTSVGERRQCVYQIRAPPGRRLMIGIEHILGYCQEGCYTTAMEMKMLGDFRPTGYRFCCLAHSFKRILSRTETAPLIFDATNATLTATIHFRWIVDTPDAEDTLSLTPQEMSEVYNQTAIDMGVDMQVLGDLTGTNVEVFLPPFDYYDYVPAARQPLNDESSYIGGWGSDGTSYKDFSMYEKEEQHSDLS